jgi:hypothetical protein
MVNVKHSGEVMRVTNNCLGITFRWVEVLANDHSPQNLRHAWRDYY